MPYTHRASSETTRGAQLLVTSSLVLVLLMCCATVESVRMWKDSEFNCKVGHYPHFYCNISTVIFNITTATFEYKSSTDRTSEAGGVNSIWPFNNVPDLFIPEGECDWYDEAHIFTFYFYHNSNYFHLHYDTLFPLYQALYAKNRHLGKVLLMPSVEQSRLQPVDFGTRAFKDDTKYWMEAFKMIAGKHDLKPLDEKLLNSQRMLCFRHAYFGTEATKVLYKHHKFMDGFVRMVKDHLEIREPPLHWEKHKPFVALVSRKGRRKILNEQELLDSIMDIADAELVEFDGMTYKQQVKSMQKFAVIAGVNGAGLMNTIYRQSDAVAIQLVPYEAGVNYEEFKLVLESKGRYLEWHNKHEHNHNPRDHDKHNQHPDTVVHVEEFRELVIEALEMSKTQYVPVKRGLTGYKPPLLKKKEEL